MISVMRQAAGALMLSAAGIGAIMYFEGTVTTVYADPIGVPTVCVGHTATVTTKDIGRRVSPSICARLLQADTAVAQEAVRRLVTSPLTQAQFDALVSFTFNVGAGALGRSTLLIKLNSGDCHGAADQFKRFKFAGGKVLSGLVVRRQMEADMFRTGCPQASGTTPPHK